MKTVVIKNEKGGQGKSTLTTHIAAGLALKGQRVLLIDGDVQAHSCYLLNVRKQGGLYNLLVQEQEWKNVLVEPDYKHWGEVGVKTSGRLLVLPGDHQTANIANSISDVILLRERLEELSGYIDTVVIDTSPTPSLLHTVLDLAADFVLYPVVCAMLPIEGLSMSVIHSKQHNKMRGTYGVNQQLSLLGVIPMMYENTLVHRNGRDLIAKGISEGLMWEPIHKRTLWCEREFHRQTLFGYAPLHEVTQEAWNVVNRMLNYV